MEDGRLKVAIWLDLEQDACKANSSLQTALQAIDRLGEGELVCAFESAKGIEDCLGNLEMDAFQIWLEHCGLRLRWESGVDLWKWLEASALGQLIALGKQTSAEVILTKLPSGLCAGVTIGKVLNYVVTQLREPVECSPALFQQLRNLLDFYETEVEFQGQFQRFGLSALVKLTGLPCLLSLNKSFPFL